MVPAKIVSSYRTKRDQIVVITDRNGKFLEFNATDALAMRDQLEAIIIKYGGE